MQPNQVHTCSSIAAQFYIRRELSALYRHYVAEYYLAYGIQHFYRCIAVGSFYSSFDREVTIVRIREQLDIDHVRSNSFYAGHLAYKYRIAQHKLGICAHQAATCGN